jgi:hypothetical protein
MTWSHFYRFHAVKSLSPVSNGWMGGCVAEWMGSEGGFLGGWIGKWMDGWVLGWLGG